MNSADTSVQLARRLKVLSVSARVRILQLLKDRTLCVNALASRLALTQGAVSQHLRIMRDAGLLVDERHGYHVHYRVDPATLALWRAEIDALLAPLSQAPAGAVNPSEGERPCVAARQRTKAARSPRT